MSEFKGTKGPVKMLRQYSNECEVCPIVVDQEGKIIATTHGAPYLGFDETIPNADLIAEAFNVLHETGLRPRELVASVAKLTNALRTAVAVIRNDANSPIWSHSPETIATRNRWCDELLEEGGISEFCNCEYELAENGEESVCRKCGHTDSVDVLALKEPAAVDSMANQ